MTFLKKVLKVAITFGLFFGVIAFLWLEAAPMYKETFDYVKRTHAKTEAMKKAQFDALTKITEDASSGNTVKSEVQKIARAGAGAASATPPKTDAGQAQGLPSDVEETPPGLAEQTADLKSENKNPADIKKTIVIDSLEDPDEARIQAMFIPESTKLEILKNYRRTGILPPALSAERQPASLTQ